MEATVNDFYGNSINYSGASLPALWRQRFREGPVATSANEVVSEPVVVRIGLPTLPPWLERARTDAEAILKLKSNWDTYGAEPIDRHITIASLILLSKVMQEGIPAPSIVPVSTGGIQVEWHKDGKHFEVEFLSAARVNYYFQDDKNHQEIENEGTVSELESEIYDLLQQAFM
jgi:hypothetical protein